MTALIAKIMQHQLGKKWTWEKASLTEKPERERVGGGEERERERVKESV